MAREVIEKLIDDLDGSEATETVTFGLDGTTYEIDLNKKNTAALRKAIEPYVKAARRDAPQAGAARLPRQRRDARRNVTTTSFSCGSGPVEMASRCRLAAASLKRSSTSTSPPADADHPAEHQSARRPSVRACPNPAIADAVAGAGGRDVLDGRTALQAADRRVTSRSALRRACGSSRVKLDPCCIEHQRATTSRRQVHQGPTAPTRRRTGCLSAGACSETGESLIVIPERGQDVAEGADGRDHPCDHAKQPSRPSCGVDGAHNRSRSRRFLDAMLQLRSDVDLEVDALLLSRLPWTSHADIMTCAHKPARASYDRRSRTRAAALFGVVSGYPSARSFAAS